MLRLLIVLVSAVAVARSMKCYQCQATVGDCIDNQCQGGWCVAIITEDKTAGTRKVEKTCAQANPSSSGIDGCSKEVSGTITTQKCGCQIEDFCNSEAGLTRLLNDKLANGGGVVGTGPQPGVGSNIPNGSAGGPVIINNSNGGSAGPQQGGQPVFPNNGQPPNGQPLPNQPPQQGGPQQGGPQPGGPQPGGPQPFPGGPQNPNLPPQQGGGPQNGQEFNNSNTPQLTRFPPPGTPTELGPNTNNPNNPNNGQPINNNGISGQRQPGAPSGNGVAPSEPEPTPKNGTWSSTTLSPNAINGQQQALDDSAPRGDKYTCVCQGPAYCAGGKCKGDFCATIEVASQDLVRGPGGPGQPPVSGNLISHSACMGAANVPGGTTGKFIKLPYSLISEGKRVTVSANEKFCTGDFCNSSAITKISAIVLMFSFVSFLLR